MTPADIAKRMAQPKESRPKKPPDQRDVLRGLREELRGLCAQLVKRDERIAQLEDAVLAPGDRIAAQPV